MEEINNKPRTLDLNLPFEVFDVNEGAEALVKSGDNVFRLPSLTDQLSFSVEDWASYWTHLSKSKGGIQFLAKDFASSLPPSTQSFGRISYMPNNSSSQLGVLQWPGLPPDTLQKLAREMLGPQMIIGIREDDVLRYADLSDQPWRPGWMIRPMDAMEEADKETRKQIRDAEQFISNSGFGKEFIDPINRDRLQRPSFSKFLLEIVRDSLTYDGIAIWIDREQNGDGTWGRINSYAPLPAGKIRLLARPDISQTDRIREGELNFYGATNMAGKKVNFDPNNPPFAVVVDETNNIVKSFAREELIWYTRNPRVDAEVSGYGYPEIEMALILVTGFNNAIQFNADIFDKNSIPKGILAIKGNFTQRQFDALGRIWDNLQRGQRADWTLPAIQLSEKGEIEVINLEPLRKEPAYYNNLINLFMGALATIFRVPVHRLGYKISGTERDSRPDTPKSLQTEEDVGLPALLTHLELLINDYLIKDRWPLLKFVFTGKSPKEDARLYEAQILAMTYNEKRASVGLKPYEKIVDFGDIEGADLISELMGAAPVDPGMAGIYQSVIAGLAKGGAFGMPMAGGEGGGGNSGGTGKIKTSGSRFTSKKDPAVSETHGHASGVRRDSKTEDKTATAKQPPNLRRRTETYSKPDTR
jgi:hypothetical protein